MVKSRTLIFVLMMVPSVCFSDSLEFYLGSYHSTPGDHNETNPGIAYQKDNWALGIVENSHKRTSMFGGVIFQPIQRIPLEVFGGYASGYGKPQEMLFLRWTVFRSDLSPVISVAPLSDGYLMVYSLKYRLH